MKKVGGGASLFQHARQPCSEIPDGIRLFAGYFTFFIRAWQPNSPPVINDIQNNTRVVLTLTLNNPHTNSPQTLFCLYQGESMEQATIECVDPKQGQLKLPVKYETSSSTGKGRINLIFPNKTLQYQVAYDVKN
ncbi:hypothetical protein WDB99_14155 [Serratia marcescens]